MAKPDPASKLAAELVCGLETEMLTEISSTGYGEMDFTVRAVAYPMDSWNKSETDYLLAHEQLHFDIAELYARQLRKQVAATSFRDGRVESQLNSIIQEMMAAYNQRQRAYDSETRHSLEKEKQAEWVTSITAELASLSDYTAHEVKASITP